MVELAVGFENDVINNKISFEERKKQIEKEEEEIQKEKEREKNSPFKSFIQVNKETWKAEDWLMSKSPIAYRVFRFLVNNMDSYNAVMCSYKVLKEHFQVSTPTIARAIKLLKENGYLAVLKSGTSNIYAINDNIVWNSWGNNKKYSKFPANVILSLSEQEKSIKGQIKALKHKEITVNYSPLTHDVR